MYAFSMFYCSSCLLETRKKNKILLKHDGSKMKELSFDPKTEEQASNFIMVKASCLWGDKTFLPLLNTIERDEKQMLRCPVSPLSNMLFLSIMKDQRDGH